MNFRVITRWAVLPGLWLGAFPSPPLSAQAASQLQLADVYGMAREGNPMLEAARALASAVGRREGSARLPPDPQLGIGVVNATLPGLEFDMPGAMAPSVQLMQMLPFPGKLGLGGDIARMETGRAELKAEETWWEVRTRTAMAFYEIHEADRRVEVMQETLGLLEDFRRVAQAMYSAGEGRQSDALRASVEVARMDAEISRMRAMRASAESRLNGTLGRAANTPVTGTALPPLPMSLPPRDTLRAWAEESRPMLADGRVGVEQARARRDLAARELWPDLSVGVEYGQRPGEMGTERMGVVMLIYLDHAWEARKRGGRRSLADLREAILEGAVERVRPKMMTVCAIIGGLLPILWGTGTGASVMKRIAAPMVGGMVSSTVLTLIVIPAVYSLWREWSVRREARAPAPVPAQMLEAPARG